MLPLSPYDFQFVAGVDEAGRGCLAGPVYAAAVILPPGFECEGLDDSKKLTPRRREQLRPIIEREAVAWAVAWAGNDEIDSINILNASILAMHRALDQLATVPAAVAVDGNRFKPWRDVPCQTFVKGDGRFACIAAASILAKTHRDEYMLARASEYPDYGWEHNMGYPTAAHLEALRHAGPTPLHRMTFAGVQPTLFDGDSPD